MSPHQKTNTWAAPKAKSSAMPAAAADKLAAFAEHRCSAILRTNVADAVGPALQAAIDEKLAGVKHRLAIGSGKGGVGKSVITTNLAVTIARSGSRVALVDADLDSLRSRFKEGLEHA